MLHLCDQVTSDFLPRKTEKVFEDKTSIVAVLLIDTKMQTESSKLREEK